MTKEEFTHEIEQFAHSEAVEQVLDLMVEDYVTSWKAAKTLEQREHLHRMATAVTALKAEIAKVATADKVTAFNKRLFGKSV